MAENSLENLALFFLITHSMHITLRGLFEDTAEGKSRKRKSPASDGIRFFGLLISRRGLYLCATTPVILVYLIFTPFLNHYEAKSDL